jgi:arylsulfatase A-like enzyme
MRTFGICPGRVYARLRAIASRMPAGLACSLLVACGDATAVPPLGRPPVIVIVFDALAAAHVGHLGADRDTTPVLDRLAREGATFTQAVAPAPYTLASIPSLLTGRLPMRHGVLDEQALLADREVTLAELLRTAGYRTHAAVANPNGGSRHGFAQGYDHFAELYRASPLGGTEPGAAASQPALRIPDAAEFVPFVARVLAEHDRAAPLHLYLHVLEPHAPYDPPAQYRDLFLDPTYSGPFLDGQVESTLTRGFGSLVLKPSDKVAARALYDANVRHADAVLGELLDLLRNAGLYDDALVIVTSDHGEAFWQHGKWGHSTTLYEEMVRVPLVVKPPTGHGVAGEVCNELVSPMDVLPSVCEWLDLPLPAGGLDGLSFAGLAAGGSRAATERADAARTGRELLLRTDGKLHDIGCRTPSAKLIAHPARKPGLKFGRAGQYEHYDLEADPKEHVNTYGAREAELAALLGRLSAAFDAHKDTQAERAAPLSGEERAVMKRLGYLGESE